MADLVNTFQEGPVPGPWGRTSYEMFQVEHLDFGDDVPGPYWKCSLWNVSAQAGGMNRPERPEDDWHGPASLRRWG